MKLPKPLALGAETIGIALATSLNDASAPQVEQTLNPTTLVDRIVEAGNDLFRALLGVLPDEQRLRLNGVEQFVEEVLGRVRVGLWKTAVDFWTTLAEQTAARCRVCDHACERSHSVTDVAVAGLTLPVFSTYYYCRPCKRGWTPVAQWLDLHHGLVSGTFEHQVVSLSTRVSFHAAATQMDLQHRQQVEVGKVERVTYAVARDAQIFLQLQHDNAVRNLERKPLRQGVALLLFTADGGGVPVGVLQRPAPENAKKFTPMRHLPVGVREQTHREMRAIVVRGPDERGQERSVDVHLSVLDHPEITGQRMRAVGAMAGLGSRTHVHGVFDMGTWIRPQFVAAFGDNKNTICTDQQHVRTYLKAAASVMFETEQERQEWLNTQEGNMQGGRWCSIVDALGPGEQKEVVAARKYIINHHEDMNKYGQLRALGLPVGSGESEGSVRHMIRKRYNIGGDWSEEHLPGMGALISIWENGLWEEFFAWREERNVEAFRARQTGTYRRRFRGDPIGNSAEQPVMNTA